LSSKSRRWQDGAGEVLGENQSGEIHEIGFAIFKRLGP
jgi:transcription-repair coupling factor (superfamily II helicase)